MDSIISPYPNSRPLTASLLQSNINKLHPAFTVTPIRSTMAHALLRLKDTQVNSDMRPESSDSTMMPTLSEAKEVNRKQ